MHTATRARLRSHARAHITAKLAPSKCARQSDAHAHSDATVAANLLQKSQDGELGAAAVYRYSVRAPRGYDYEKGKLVKNGHFTVRRTRARIASFRSHCKRACQL